MPELLFSQRGTSLFRFPLTQANIRIGRSPECDVILSGENISRLQLMIYQSDGSYLAKNVGKQALQVNGKETESVALKSGENLKLGEWEILFHLDGKAEGSFEETYVSKTGSGETKLIHATSVQGKFCADKICFKIQEPQKKSRNFFLAQEVTTVGKSASCDVVLSDSYCSDVHCKLIVKKEQLILFDLNSSNGSFVEGVRVREAVLQEGQKILLGKTELTLEFIPEEIPLENPDLDFFGPLVGKSPPMKDLYQLIQRVAPTEATVCIFGETGSGKELVAKSLHDLSPRNLKPFVALNCGAISKELIESELFGHEKGAFTGAHQQRQGVFEQASGGTLFLDEMAELPLKLQSTLLRVLETGKIRRVGGNAEIPVDVRVLCATHQDLAQRVKDGEFREDLFFRLYVFPLFIPPLRERRKDIPLIAEHFLKSMAVPGKKYRFTSEALHHLETQEWRGNVRELKNTIQRALVLAQNEEIGMEELKLHPEKSSSSEKPEEKSPQNVNRLEQLEREMILKELKAQEGNRGATAKALGIAKSTLYEKLKGYGVK